MFTLNVGLKNAEEVSEFKAIMTEYDKDVTMIIGGHTVARPMITSSPYITPLDDITVQMHSESVNEFMNMIRKLDQYIGDNQDVYTVLAIDRVRAAMQQEEQDGIPIDDIDPVN